MNTTVKCSLNSKRKVALDPPFLAPLSRGGEMNLETYVFCRRSNIKGAILRFGDGQYECPYCGKRMPTHYYRSIDVHCRTLKRYISAAPNMDRHIIACFKKLMKKEPA